MSEKKWKQIKTLLLIGSVLAALKIIFFDYSLDEEYQIMMGYRAIKGDVLFREMWEPHQTSAFLCTGLMWIYHWITGGWTGILLFLRVCTTVIQIVFSVWLYRVLCHYTEKNYAFLLAVIYFNVVPKIIQIPEFSNMQLWFFTMMILWGMEYYSSYQKGDRSRWYLLVLAGVGMALEVLAYPSCLIIFPFYLGYIGVKSVYSRWRDMGIFAGTCGVCGVSWLGLILSQISPEDFLRNLEYVLSFDLTHEISGATAGKGQGIVSNLLIGGGLFALMTGLSVLCLFLYEKRKGKLSADTKKVVFWVFMVLAAEGVQLFFWVVLQKGYEVPQIHLLTMLIAGLAVWRLADEKKKLLFPGIAGSILSLLAVIYISDLEMFYSIPHGLLGHIFSALVLVMALEKVLQEQSKRWCHLLLVSLAFFTIFGKGFTVRSSNDYNTILGTGNIMKYGPAIGVAADYMNAYIYNSNYEDFRTYIREGENVLIVANMVMSTSTTPYMFADGEVSHYSIVDPTAYDERLLTYWELYPEKYPDVIVVDCWYGEVMENPESWIMQYIEQDFGYTQVYDGRYVRFYKR